MSMPDIKQYSYWLGVKCYEECQGAPLHKDLIAQYIVPRFPGMLLSPGSWKAGPGCYSVCKHCKVAMTPLQSQSKKPFKCAIANGFAIDSFPNRIPYSSSWQEGESRSIDVMKCVHEIMKALVASVDHLVMCAKILEGLKMHPRTLPIL